MTKLSEPQWLAIKAALHAQMSKRGRPAKDTEQFFNAVLWYAERPALASEGSGYRTLPTEFQPVTAEAVRIRLERWRKQNTWKRLFDFMASHPAFCNDVYEFEHDPFRPDDKFPKGFGGNWSSQTDFDRARMWNFETRTLPIAYALLHYVRA